MIWLNCIAECIRILPRFLGFIDTICHKKEIIQIQISDKISTKDSEIFSIPMVCPSFTSQKWPMHHRINFIQIICHQVLVKLLNQCSISTTIYLRWNSSWNLILIFILIAWKDKWWIMLFLWTCTSRAILSFIMYSSCNKCYISSICLSTPLLLKIHINNIWCSLVLTISLFVNKCLIHCKKTKRKCKNKHYHNPKRNSFRFLRSWFRGLRRTRCSRYLWFF